MVSKTSGIIPKGFICGVNICLLNTNNKKNSETIALRQHEVFWKIQKVFVRGEWKKVFLMAQSISARATDMKMQLICVPSFFSLPPSRAVSTPKERWKHVGEMLQQSNCNHTTSTPDLLQAKLKNELMTSFRTKSRQVRLELRVQNGKLSSSPSLVIHRGSAFFHMEIRQVQTCEQKQAHWRASLL